MLTAEEAGAFLVNGETWRIGERYELVDILGSGSYGEVARARDRVRGREVAVKRLPHIFRSREFAKRVIREVAILRHASHPGIMRLRDVVVAPASSGPRRLVNGNFVSISLDVFLVSDLAEGDVYALRGELTPVEVRDVMWQLLDAVNYLHLQGVLHPDIKSSNFLWRSEPC